MIHNVSKFDKQDSGKGKELGNTLKGNHKFWYLMSKYLEVDKSNLRKLKPKY